MRHFWGRVLYLTGTCRSTCHRVPALLLLLLPAVLVTGCWQDKYQEEENGGLRGPPTASFNPASIVTGFTLPAAQSTIQSQDVTLTVRPAAAAANVTLAIAGTNRATIVNVRRGPGTITFNAKGTSATPANMPNGDTRVEARLGNRVLATANVVVVIPTAVGTPHPTFNGRVTGSNIIMDATTSPAFFGILPAGEVKLATAYTTTLNVPVVDQFGTQLNAIYAGTAVTEQQGFAINQNMQANGTYRDPVGLLQIPRANTPRERPPGTANPQLAAHTGNPAPRFPPVARNFNQNKLVQVGGHMLNPAVVNRQVTITLIAGSNTQANLRIVWP